MDRSQFHNLLKKYLSGQADSKEQRVIDKWYDRLDSAPQQLTDAEKQQLRDAIKDCIDLRIEAPAHISRNGIRRFKKYWGIAAAGLLVFVSASLWLWESNQSAAIDIPVISYVEVLADQRKLKSIQLPDSSTVWLNSGSKIRFAMPFDTGDTRQVEVDYGEVFFDVRPDSTRPFVVRSSELTTRVLGTSFTIKAYPSLHDIQISVLTGQVEVSGADSTVLGSLSQGDQLVYDREERSSFIRHVDTEHSNSWISGITYLSQASFAELALVIENAYNLQLVAGNQQILRQKYSIQLDRQTPIEDIVKAICDLYKNKYRKEGDKITIY